MPRVWEERFQQDYGFLRAEVSETFDAYLNCGILESGVARIRCPDCGHSSVVAFSCKKRGVCPSCNAKRAILFAEHLCEEVLKAVPHRHLVFSIPKIIRPYFRYDRKRSSILFQASWETISKMYDVLIPGGTPGAIPTFQSAGANLKWNPHIHSIATSGSFLPDGSFHTLPYFDAEKFTAVFAEKVLSLMKEASLIDDDRIALIKTWEHSGFSVWAGPEISPQDIDTQHFLARYIDRGPLSLQKLLIEDGRVLYVGDDEERASFDPLDFLARLSAHVTDKWESCVRYFGVYSHRTRGEERKKASAAADKAAGEETQTIPVVREPKRKASRLWASLIKKIYEVDPLLCPKCGGQMKIIAFIQDPREIKKLISSLGIPPFEAPPPMRAPPESTEPDMSFDDF